MMRPLLLLIPVALLTAAACQSDDAPVEGTDSPGGKADDSDATGVDTRGYAFVLEDSKFSVRRDHAGAPLLATIFGRIAEYSIEAPFIERHAYNDSEGSNNLPWVAHITKRFTEIHAAWGPSFEEMGLDTCDPLGLSDDALFDEDGVNLDALEPEQCFGQRILWPNPDTGEVERYRRTIQVAIPDYVTIALDEPAAFPNGRVLDEQINSLMFALAFLDHGGECTDQQGNTSDCDLHTLWERTDFLKQHNDVPYAGATEIGVPPRAFPFLGLAHRTDD